MFKFQFGEPEPEVEQSSSNAASELLPAQVQSIDLLKASAPKISYTVDHHGIPRRDLFDVRFQLMGEDNVGPEEQILLDGNEDVRKSVYEGGLKVWEGANDLVEAVAADAAVPAHAVLELGCGAGVPACFLLHRAIAAGKAGRFVFADYNPAVLRLLTMPNVVLAWLSATHAEGIHTAAGTSGEADMTRETTDAMLADLQKRGIIVEFVSGAWSQAFSAIVGSEFDLVLASETIYSLDSLPAFTDVLQRAMRPGGTALVAAKKVYFGVGGGVVEFERLLDERSVKHALVAEKGNVGRVVIKVN